MTTALIIGDTQRCITGAYPFARQVVAPLTELLPRARSAGVLAVSRAAEVVACVDWPTRAGTH
jgi:hypothetical protein